jgi:hypothetical protein
VEALVHTNSSTNSKWKRTKSKKQKKGFRKSTITTIAATIEAKQRDFSKLQNTAMTGVLS